jgi:hypothetical protein
MTDIDKFDMLDFSPDLLLNNAIQKSKRHRLRMRRDLPPLIVNTMDDGSLEILLGMDGVVPIYFVPEKSLKGIFIWRSIETGKICTEMAKSRSRFDKENYKILWATRNDLTSHVCKNTFEQVELQNDVNIKRSTNSIIKPNIRELVTDAKEHMAKIKKKVTEIREQLKKRNLFMTETTKDVTNERMDELQLSLKNDMEIYKDCVQKIKKLLKTNLSDLERSVVKMVLKDEQKTMRAAVKIKKKEMVTSIQVEKKAIKQTIKKREKIYVKLRKTLKKTISDEKKTAKKIKTAEEKLRKTLRKQEGFHQEFKYETIKGLANKYAANIDSEIEKARSEILGKENAKLKKAADKVVEKEAKKQQKIADRETRKREKAAEKEARNQTRKKKQFVNK